MRLFFLILDTILATAGFFCLSLIAKALVISVVDTKKEEAEVELDSEECVLMFCTSLFLAIIRLIIII